MLRAALGTILTRNLRLSKLSIIVGDIRRGAGHDMGASCEIESLLPNLGGVARDTIAVRDIGTKFAIEQVVNESNPWRSCEWF